MPIQRPGAAPPEPPQAQTALRRRPPWGRKGIRVSSGRGGDSGEGERPCPDFAPGNIPIAEETYLGTNTFHVRRNIF
jgi:hypothetical protein